MAPVVPIAMIAVFGTILSEALVLSIRATAMATHQTTALSL
jgi:hypothetical protein